MLTSISFAIGSLLLLTYCTLAQSLENEAKEHMCLDVNFDSFIHTDRQKHSWVPCEREIETPPKSNKLSYLRFNENINTQKSITKPPFDINLQCFHVTDAVCQKAKRAFQNAGKIISDVVLFKETIRVNATLMSFCQMNNECNKGMMTLGGSSPTRAIPLQNDDGLTRLHPQALVKQFGLLDHPAFAPYDILSVFNADAPFWFEEDGLPIQPNQADFLFVVLHEFMHGLGFYSSWNEYISSGSLTPDPSPFLANQFISMVNPSSTALHTTQFLESAMDRLMFILSHEENHIPVSDLTRQLNKIQVNTLDQLVLSPSFRPAKEMAIFATYPKSLGLTISTEDNPIVLETGLKPFQPGSSISHVDYDTYTMSPDFLMRFMQDRGVTLQDAVKRGGGTGPIGPLLLGVLEEIGYSTVNKPENIPRLLLFQRGSVNTTLDHTQRKKGYQHRVDAASVESISPYSLSSLSLLNILTPLCMLFTLIK